ncbi:MAG: ribosome biogenesis protein [Nitrososphaeria archaeon]
MLEKSIAVINPIFILAETALETIPLEISGDKIIVNYCKKRKKKPSEVLLDQSYHHKAILQLKDHEKRGRPDIAHFSLLEATSIPLYFENKITVYAHTLDDRIIEVGTNVRLPRVYERFVGLIEKLYSENIIKGGEKVLLKLYKGTLKELLSKIKPSIVIGLSRLGEKSNFRKVALFGLKFERPVFVVGGFAKGTFKDEHRLLMNHIFSISNYSLDAHVVTARLLYEVEKNLSNKYD